MENDSAAQATNFPTCQRCGQKLRAGELFRFACGKLQGLQLGGMDTRRFTDATDPLYQDAHFETTDVLVLVAALIEQTFVLWPKIMRISLSAVDRAQVPPALTRSS
jgi:hypothetical protein